MAKKKIWVMLCIVTALCLAGCQSGGTGASGENAEVQKEAVGNTDYDGQQEDGSITGQVTSVNGNEITLALVEMAQRGSGGPDGADGETAERPEGAERPERPEGETMAEGAERPERPEGETMAEGEEPQEGQKGGPGGNGGGRGGMNTTGEEQTITVSDETTYTMDANGESQDASLADIEEGSFLRVVMDGDTVVSISIMNMDRGGRGTPENNDESDAPAENTISTEL